MKTLKMIIKTVLRDCLRLFPNTILFGMILRGIRKLPERISLSLIDLFPTHRRFIFQEYLGNIHIAVDTWYPIDRLVLHGDYDPGTLAVIERLVQPGHVCVDIGANIGAITFALAKRVQPDGMVFAFEPGTPNFTKLAQNVQLNPSFKNIIIPMQMGMADHPGTLCWQEDGNYPGNANCLSVTEGNGELVQVTTLDDYFSQHPVAQLHFIKIDVEGMEYEVIKGGLSTLAQYQPILYYETMAEFERFRQRPLFLEIEKMLKLVGYTFFKALPNYEIVDAAYPNLGDNTIAIHESKVRAILG
jgi:FkbM family methyltransferase